MNKIDCWKIQILGCAGTKCLDINESDSFFVLNKCDKVKWHTWNGVNIEADPFLFVSGDTLHLFYESKVIGKVGVLKMISTKDLKHWTEAITVLEESYHLSYPFVFEDNGFVYMIPETGADKSIRLYRATDNTLTHFLFEKYLITGHLTDDVELSYCDSSVLLHDGIYYLHTTVQRNGVYELHLYCSASLQGKFVEHPQSPVCVSNKYGRNAGSIIREGDQLFRPTQDCEHSYGEDVHLMQIQELTPKIYKETLVKENMLKGLTSYYRYGGHHWNQVHFHGKTIVATDAKDYKKMLANRLMAKIAKKIKL